MRSVCIFLLCSLTISAFAQLDNPRAEVFGGYSYLHIDTQGISGPTLDSLCNTISPGFCPAGTFQVHSNFNGWNAAVQVNVNRFLGIKADFSGNYGKPITLSSQAQSFLTQRGVTGLPPSASSYNYLFGPVLFQNKGHYTPFAHALFGQNRVSTSLSNIALNGVGITGIGIPGLTLSDTAFAMALGGGLDVRLGDHILLRAGQADYLFTKHDFSGGVPGIATHQNNVRVSVGVVFQFGATHEAQPEEPRRSAPNVISARGILIPVLGLYVIDNGSDTGARVTNVTLGKGSLRPGDVINSVGGKPVKTSTDLVTELSHQQQGAKVTLGYLVSGQWQTDITLVLGNQ